MTLREAVEITLESAIEHLKAVDPHNTNTARRILRNELMRMK